MAQAPLPLPQVLPTPRSFGETNRRDGWMAQPIAVALGFTAFIVYSTLRAIEGKYFLHGEYLSPFYSPLLFDMPGAAATGHAWFGAWPSWIPGAIAGISLSPAFFILWAPGGFRFTCYYYRGAYYKAFWGDPANCAVGEPGFRGKRYRGERWLPLVMQNVHRYFLYVAIVFIVLLAWDAVKSYVFTGTDGTRSFGIGVGSLVLTLNPIFLGCYTFGCHSLRHLIGGRNDKVGTSASKGAYDCVSCLNRRHMLWAWVSLFWVGFTDFYVRSVSAGWFTDLRII